MMAMAEYMKTISMSTHLAVATFLRLVLIAYGQQQDMMMEVGDFKPLIATIHHEKNNTMIFCRLNTLMWTIEYSLMGQGMFGKAGVHMIGIHTGKCSDGTGLVD